MSDVATGCLQVFARVPVAGRVKTRLIPALGAAGAATVYRRLLGRTLDAAAGTPVGRLEVWFDTPADAPGVPPLPPGAVVRSQRGDDLGARMAHALAAGVAAFGPTVLVGSDCPEITPAYLGSAFAALDGHDAVIGPAADGGYVLIGLRRLDPRLFTGVPWSTPDVLAATRARLEGLGWRWRELPCLRDIDRYADLAPFPELWHGAGADSG